MSQSEQTDQIWAALAIAQGTMKNAAFDAVNPHFKNKYASLASVVDATREALSKNGLALTHTTDVLQRLDHTGSGEVYIEKEYLVTTLGHKSGQWISSRRTVPQGMKAQEYGAWLTYNRRYALCAMVGISADEDDDGNIAQASNGKRENPNVNRAPDFASHEVSYDAEGNPVDNIPYGNPELQQLRGVTARKEYEILQSEMIAIGDVKDLRKWANQQHTKDRVQTLSTDWQQHMRDLYEGRKKELSAAAPRTA